MKRLLILLLAGCSFCAAQNNAFEILGLRVYAFNDEYLPPIVAMGQKITIEFDVAAVHPPDLQILFVHASKDWVPDDSPFVNDQSHNKSQQIQFGLAPVGVHQYSYHYKNFFPDDRGAIRFPFSGNYLFTIVEKESSGVVLAEGRFIVVENSVEASLRVDNKFYSEQPSPLNQMHYITINVNVPAEESQPVEGRIFHPNVKTVDIIRNWELYNPYRIDVEDKNPDTFVEEFYRPNKRFKIRNVPPGNEYRRLDIGSVRFYPNGLPVRLKEGADLSRYQWQGKIDANGAAKLAPFIGVNSDYLDVTLRLELPAPNEKSIFLVGAFNQWQPTTGHRMELDSLGKLYTLHKWIRRGVYDYQYVVGSVDPAMGDVADQDWLALEGNDWRTINRYTALVYYHDERFGGFDRVVGSAIAKSPGGTDETKATLNEQ
jgi:hypothetical protein